MGTSAVIAIRRYIVQTQVPLQAIGPVIHGYHENPFEVLGPHEIEQAAAGAGRAGVSCPRPSGPG